MIARSALATGIIDTMRLACVLVVLASCIEPDLVRCGDLLCSPGSVCLGGELCATPAQLAACASEPEDATCILEGGEGRCQGGACTLVACGNMRVDPGEVCDDGNKSSGDDCSGTCTSDETCGNGILDVAKGETCDCGVSGSVAIACTEPNSDAVTAACDSQCHSRFCGDSVIGGAEQCDGTTVPSDVDCKDFGYYQGSLTCNGLCQLSPTQCDGRCGDDLVDTGEGELCDGAITDGSSCLTYGLDQGELTCGPVCAPAFADCNRLMWTDVHEGYLNVSEMWGGDGRIAVRYASTDAWVLASGLTAKAPGTGYKAVTGSQTYVWAVGSAALARWSATMGWQVETPPWDASLYVRTAWASDAIGLAVTFVNSNQIHWRAPDGTWTTTTAPAANGYLRNVRSGMYLATSGTTYHLNGTVWEPFATQFTTLRDLAEDDMGRLWATADNSVWRLDNGTWTQVVANLPLQSLVGTADGVYGGNCTFGPFGSSTFYVAEVTDTTTEIFASPHCVVVRDGTNTPFVGSSAGLQALRRGQWSLEYDNTIGSNVEGADSAPGGPFVTAQPRYALGTGGKWLPVAGGPAFGASDCAITASGKLFCVERYGNRAWDGDQYVTIGAVGQVGSLWVADDDHAAVGGESVFAVRDENGWTLTNPPITFYAIEGDAIDDLYALAQATADSGPRIWHFDGADWTAVTPIDNTITTGCRAGFDQTLCSPGTRLVVTSTQVMVTGSDITIYDRSTTAVTHLAGPVTFTDLAVAPSGDLFAIGGLGSFDRSPLWHYDGTTWSPVRTPEGVVSLSGLATYGDRVIVFSGGTSMSNANKVYVLQRTGTW